jgi:hypothetical protein
LVFWSIHLYNDFLAVMGCKNRIWLELNIFLFKYSLDMEPAFESDIRAISVCNRDICVSWITKIGGSSRFQLGAISFSHSG